MSTLSGKLVSFLRAHGGKASARELMQAINVSGASDATAQAFLRTALAQCVECEETNDGAWRLTDDKNHPARQAPRPPNGRVSELPNGIDAVVDGTQPDRAGADILPEQKPAAFTPSGVRETRANYRIGHASGDPPHPATPFAGARFAVLFVACERIRRPRAVAAAVAQVENLRRLKATTIVLGRMRRGLFVPGEAAVSALEGLLSGEVPLVVFSDGTGLVPLRRTFAAVGRELDAPPVIRMENLAGRLGTHLAIPLEEDEPGPVSAAAVFCENAVNRLADEFIRMLEALTARGNTTVGEIFSLAAPAGVAVSFAGRAFDESFLRQLPREPGTYWFMDRNGDILYVGKAKNLCARVSSYFVGNGDADEKQARILDEACNVGYHVLGSELEALLEEARLIRRHEPPINVQTEVHARTEPGLVRLRRRSFALFLTAVDPGSLRVFLVSPTRYEIARVKRGTRDPARLLRRVRSFFFEAGAAAGVRDGKGKRKLARGHAGLSSPGRAGGRSSANALTGGGTFGKRKNQDAELEIIYSWLRRNRDMASFIDVGKSAGYADCVRLVKAHLASPETGYVKVEWR